jgi:hypothetical protein
MKLLHPVVMLFGAGATKGGLRYKSVPPPVDADFFEIAGQIKGHGTPKLARTVLGDVWTLYGKVPETDLLAKALFAEVVRHRAARNHYLRELHLADPNESVKQRLVDVFVPALNAQSKVFRYAGIDELKSRMSKKTKVAGNS